MCLFLLIYLITYLTSIDSWIYCTQYLSSNTVLLYFVIQIWPQELFQLASMPIPLSLGHCARVFWFIFLFVSLFLSSSVTYHCGAFSFSISYFLAVQDASRCFWSTRCSRLILFMSCPRPWSSHFSKEPQLLPLENGIRIHYLSACVLDAVRVPINVNLEILSWHLKTTFQLKQRSAQKAIKSEVAALWGFL